LAHAVALAELSSPPSTPSFGALGCESVPSSPTDRGDFYGGPILIHPLAFLVVSLPLSVLLHPVFVSSPSISAIFFFH